MGLGISSSIYRDNKTNTSISANRRPMHDRGPKPNGKYTNELVPFAKAYSQFWLFFIQRSGMKVSDLGK